MIVDEIGWSPGPTLEGAQKLDDVRLALRQGDLKAALRFVRLYRLEPVA